METKNNLRKLVFEALKVSQKVRVAHRTEGVKFAENEAIIRWDIEKHRGLSVGDSCIFSDTQEPRTKYIIAAFVEMNGWVIGAGKIRFRDIFCILTLPPDAQYKKPYHRILTETIDGPVHLWRVERLKKV